MTRFAPLLLVTGCFYVDPINQRPSADIHPASDAIVYRGDHIELDAVTTDPEGQNVSVQWRAYACSDATTPAGCDSAPFYTDVLTTAQIDVPKLRADSTTPVLALRIILDATDDLGATAKPSQELLVPVADRPPTVKLSADSRHGYVLGIPIDVFATVGDADDDPAKLVLAWQAFSPPGTPPGFVDEGEISPGDPTRLRHLLTPMTLGDYDIAVTATDPLGVQTTSHLPITAVADHAPCLAQWAPLAPPPGDVLPMQDPTLFEVLVVEDDLDPYPATGDPLLGQTSFAWSLLPPGASSRQSLAVVGNSVPLDPSTYTPGDVLELRVEIQDRNHTPVTCPDSDPTCSVISDPSCIQRLTWRVEVQ